MTKTASLLLTVLAFAANTALAQEWPHLRQVRLVVGFAPGGANDIVSRLMAQQLTERMKQTFYVENKPGAAARIATSFVAKEKPDGYTLLMGAPGLLVLNHFLYKDVDYKLPDFTGVSLIGTLPYVLVASAKVNVGTVSELVALARQRPGLLNHGSTGAGPVLVQQLFKDRTGIQFQNLTYKGTAPALQDLMRGDLHFMFDLIAGNVEQIRSGTIRALAVSAPRRSSSLPEVPTMTEAGFTGFDPTNWYGIVAPAGTPAAILNRLSREINASLADATVRQRLIQLGVEPSGSTPQEFNEHLRKEYALWETVTRNAGIQKE